MPIEKHGTFTTTFIDDVFWQKFCEQVRQEKLDREYEARRRALAEAPRDMAEQLYCLYVIEDVLAQVGMEPIVEVNEEGNLVVWIQERDSQ